jgi:photosystem II stability/assembly factor-like uncharacterized protein
MSHSSSFVRPLTAAVAASALLAVMSTVPPAEAADPGVNPEPTTSLPAFTDRGESGEGFSWQEIDTGTGDLRGLDAVSAEVAWASDDSGKVLRTVDGGETFKNVSPSGQWSYRDVEAQSADVAQVLGVLCCSSSIIYRTTDGGRTWTETFKRESPNAGLNCMTMIDRRHGVVMANQVDGKFQVLVTSDAGRSWSYAPASGMPDALPGEIGFHLAGTCATATGRNVFFGTGGGEEARVFRSADYGLTWSVSSTPMASSEYEGIFALDFQTNRLGIAIGGHYGYPGRATDALARTTDGGVTWSLVDESRAPTGYRTGLAWYADHRGDAKASSDPRRSIVIAVGPTGSDVSFNRGKTWQQFDDSRFHAVECVVDACWASGSSGLIATLVS